METIEDEARAALRQQPSTAAIEPDLPPFSQWVPLHQSKAWFSEFHFTGNEAFELPFHPSDFVYSPVVNLPIPAGTNATGAGHFRRGVRKFQTMINKGQTLPPITLVYDPYERGDPHWVRLDGNHRWEAAVTAGLTHIPAILAIRRL